MLKLLETRDANWVKQVLTAFADDFWGNWLIQSMSDVRRAIQDITHIISILESFHFKVNFRKTAVLLRLEGQQAAKALESITVRVEGDTYLEIQIQGDTRRIPVRTQHEYLGTAVTYQRRLDQNVAKRMQSGQMRYQDIRRTLNGRQALSITQRTSLWRTCIYTSLMYSVPAVGPPVSHTPASDGEQKAKAGAAPSWAAEDLGTASTSVSLKPLPTGRVTPEPKPLTRGIHAHVPIDATSRGSAGITTPGSWPDSLREAGSAQCPAGTLQGINRLAREEGPERTIREPKPTQDSLAFLCHPGASPAPTDRSCHGGESEQPAQGRMINQDDHWVYQRWCAKTKKLILDPGRSPMSNDNAVRLLTQLRDGLKGDIIQKFGAAQPLYRLEEAGHQSATFCLEMSLRGQESHEVHRMLLDLVNNAMTHLVGISIKRETNQRSKLAQQLADMTFRGSGSQW